MRRRPQFPHHIILPQGFSTCSQSHPVLQANVCVALKHPHAHAQSMMSICVSLTVGVSVVTLRRGVSCVTNSNPDHSFWISYLLQSCKERKKQARDKDILKRCSRLRFPWQSHTSPLSLSSKAQKQNSK